MENYLEYYYKKYPQSEIKDFFKLIYQSTFGTGHMIDGPAESLSRLKEEITKIEPINYYEDLYDYISYDYVRVNLRVYKYYNLNVNLLNESFINTSLMFVDNNKIFTNELNVLKRFFTKKGFDTNELDIYLEEFEDNNYQDVHHSKTYRKVYAPAYRIIHQKFLSEELQYYQVRHFLDSFDKTKINFFALEGKAASGKTTITNLLEKDDDVTVIHVDDFFDYSDEEIGINSLRIVKEIIHPAIINKPLKFKKYDCTTKTFIDTTIESLNSIVVIEGVFSCNSILEEYYKGIIYLHINEDSQQERLIKRNRLLYNRFVNEWIPRENNYFKKYNIFKKANIIV